MELKKFVLKYGNIQLVRLFRAKFIQFVGKVSSFTKKS